MVWDNNKNKESLRKVIKRLDIIQGRCPNPDADPLFEQARSKIRQIIEMLIDDRLHPRSVKRRVLDCYTDPGIDLDYISERFNISKRTIIRWAKQENLPKRRHFKSEGYLGKGQ